MRMLPLALFALLTPAMVLAHPAAGHIGGGQGFGQGVLHPLTGADHLLAMVAVGLWSALAGGRAVWAGPLAFVGVMVLAGLLGAGGPVLEAAEHLILASVIVLGVAMALALRGPLPVALVMIAVFGAAHGWAHGVEGPGAGGGAGIGYAAGFALATLSLHGLGLAIGRFVLTGPRPSAILRGLGGVTALAGVALAII